VEVVTEARHPRAVDLTSLCSSDASKPQRLFAQWKHSEQTFLIGIWLVHHVDAATLFNKTCLIAPKHYQESICMVRRKLIGTDDEILPEDSFKISLDCMISLQRIVTPVRSKYCAHLQCFDLQTYLAMNEKKNNWKCPKCGARCYLDDLIIDK
jgi:hypothetical protein